MSRLTESLKRLESAVGTSFFDSREYVRQFLQKVAKIAEGMGFKVHTASNVRGSQGLAGVTLTYNTSKPGEAGAKIVDMLKRKFGINLTLGRQVTTRNIPYTSWVGGNYKGFELDVSESVVGNRAKVRVHCDFLS